jgi:hypothetical protein
VQWSLAETAGAAAGCRFVPPPTHVTLIEL